MNEKKKGGPQGFGAGQWRGSHPGKPSIVQTKKPAPQSATRPPAPGLKMTGAAQVRKIPAAPPVYRPQPVPRVLQTKSRGSNQLTQTKLSPSAPQAYRPQTVPKVLQRQPAPGNLLSLSAKRAVKTAAGYPPRSTPKVLQAKTNATSGIARPLTGTARFNATTAMAGTQLRRANATIQLSSEKSTPAPTLVPAPVLVPVITPKSESETQKAIEAELTLWMAHVKGGGDTSKGWNTGSNGQGGKNEYITKADFDTLNAWWTKKTDKVSIPQAFTYTDWLTKQVKHGTRYIPTSVTYRTAASSQWDQKSTDVLCDFLCQVGDKGGFNFHIHVIDRFKK